MNGGTGGRLDRTFIVLHEPQDLVNIALAIRAMKNLGMSRLRLVEPAEFDPWRIGGIAHDTQDIVDRVELFDDLPAALADASYVLGATARRRSARHDWWSPAEAAEELVPREEPLAVVFGREDRGLSNDALDLCHGLVCIPANPDHSSMNLAHAAVIIMYELRKVALGPARQSSRDIAYKKRRQSPPAQHRELEAFFDKWQRAMEEIGLFHGIDPVPKMRSFRKIFQRAKLDRREIGLLLATAYEVLHFGEREKKRAADRASLATLGPGAGRVVDEQSSSGGEAPDSDPGSDSASQPRH